jgi:hypothetical protein
MNKKLRNLNEVVKEYNGVMARYSKLKSKENEALLNTVLSKLAFEANEVIID